MKLEVVQLVEKLVQLLHRRHGGFRYADDVASHVPRAHDALQLAHGGEQTEVMLFGDAGVALRLHQDYRLYAEAHHGVVEHGAVALYQPRLLHAPHALARGWRGQADGAPYLRKGRPCVLPESPYYAPIRLVKLYSPFAHRAARLSQKK